MITWEQFRSRVVELFGDQALRHGALTLVSLALLLLATWAVSRGVVTALRAGMRRLAPDIEESSFATVRRVVIGVVYLMGAGVGFGILGIDLTALADAFQVLNFRITGIGSTEVTLMTPVILVLVWVLTGQVSQAFQRGVAQAGRVRDVELDEGSVAVFQRLVHYVVLTIGAIVALQVLGIDLSTLLAAGAVFAVGVGLAMQNLAQNFVSGILLLLERAIKPGDVVMVDGQVVQVRELGIRSTIGRTRDGEDIIIPNSLLVQNPVKNLTHENRAIRVRMPVGVAYDTDMGHVIRVLSECARNITWRSPGTEPIVLWLGFGTSSVDFEVSVWGTDPWRLPQLRTDLAREVWNALKAARIVIAFPQVDVHFDGPVEEALRLVGGRDSAS